MTPLRSRIAIILGLVTVTLAVYSPVIHHDFTNYDDPDYVADNQHVSPGLTWEGLSWAFTRIHGERTYWHPLTWISHMVDCQVFGLKPAGHHLMNLLFHALNTMLVFLVFLRMTGAVWRCAMLAGLFALHPLQVDTVAWVAERKNLLATAFGLLTIWAYALYADKTGGQGQKSKPANSKFAVQGSKFRVQGSRFPVSSSIFHPPSSILYILCLLLFACSLMSKPMLVTLPFLLLLLDFWPLRRRQKADSSTPQVRSHFILHPSSFILLEKLPFLLLAAASGVITILAHRGLGMLAAGAARPLGYRIENAVVSYARYLGNSLWPSKLAIFYPLPVAWPALTVALCGLLLLAVSILAIGMARKHPYLFVGWFWFAGVLVPFIGLLQVGAQAMADRFAYFPLIGLFTALVWTAAELSSRWPHRTRVVPCMAILLLLLCAGLSRRQLAHWQNSIALFEHALAVTPGNFLAHQNLGEALSNQGRLEEASLHLNAAMQLLPDHPETHYELGHVRLRQGRTSEAIEQYHEALRLRPAWPGVLNNLAWLLSTHPSAEFRNGAEAVALAERACQLTGRTNLWMLSTLAAAYAEAGRYPEAASTQQSVCDLAAAQGQSAQTESFQRRLDLYRSGKAYHLPETSTSRP